MTIFLNALQRDQKLLGSRRENHLERRCAMENQQPSHDGPGNYLWRRNEVQICLVSCSSRRCWWMYKCKPGGDVCGERRRKIVEIRRQGTECYGPIDISPVSGWLGRGFCTSWSLSLSLSPGTDEDERGYLRGADGSFFFMGIPFSDSVSPSSASRAVLCGICAWRVWKGARFDRDSENFITALVGFKFKTLVFDENKFSSFSGKFRPSLIVFHARRIVKEISIDGVHGLFFFNSFLHLAQCSLNRHIVNFKKYNTEDEMRNDFQFFVGTWTLTWNSHINETKEKQLFQRQTRCYNSTDSLHSSIIKKEILRRDIPMRYFGLELVLTHGRCIVNHKLDHDQFWLC